MEWIDSLHWEGILIGICTFLIIGLFHPIVVKAEYYWGTRCWWIFLLLGIAGLIGSVLVSQILLSTLLGVFSFSSFWTIKEVFEQRERVLKGWFPMNPKRKKEYEQFFCAITAASGKSLYPTLYPFFRQRSILST